MNTQEPLPLWGGPECTINRVRDRYHDQFELSGHARRLGDLDKFAALGLRTLRYPLCWERISPDGVRTEWAWSDARMDRLRALGISPIAGLIHHGSGPPTTSLLDPEFAEKLAAHALGVARRYPWIRDYVPVNEPLTTARFSCLYGHWYPHERGDHPFVRALLNQCRAVVLCMRAIREVNPGARLVQTEDMGFTRSTQALAYQADFDNERRFLTFDLLTGKVDRSHPLHGFLRASGATERELAWFTENRCPPDLLGVNYYVTSERFLDDRIRCYPKSLVGGNSRELYADVEAVRVCADGLVGPAAILRQVWVRYGLPVAVTEAHIGCTVDEQIRWLLYVFGQAEEARRSGVDVRAVTAWALLGSHGWSNLVTTAPEVYEPGVFAICGQSLTETPLAPIVAALCESSRFLTYRADLGPGWWERPERLLHPPYASRLRAA